MIVESKGYRILGKIPRLPVNVLENLIDEFQTLQGIINASPSQLGKVDGIGQARTTGIINVLKPYKN